MFARADPLNLTGLRDLSRRVQVRSDIYIGVIDGPVVLEHPYLEGSRVRVLATDKETASEFRRRSDARAHGTFVVGLLAAARSSPAPGLCPDSTILVRPIFGMRMAGGEATASAEELARAIRECVDSGAEILNLSLEISGSRLASEALVDALNDAAKRGVVMVAAAGNSGRVAGSVLHQHPGVLSVVACSDNGAPLQESSLATSIGTRGVRFPAVRVVGLGADGDVVAMSGSSAATPHIAGAIALLMSLFPAASARQAGAAVIASHRGVRRSVLPPLLDVRKAIAFLTTPSMRKEVALQG